MADYSKLSEVMSEGHRLLTGGGGISTTRIHSQFGRWVNTISNLLDELSGRSGLSLEWQGLGVSPLVHGGHYYNDEHTWAKFEGVMNVRLNWLGQVPKRIAMQEQSSSEESLPQVLVADTRPVARNTRDVFIVHGRDEEVKAVVARFLEKLGLNPIILHEQPNKGRTVIEKFEAYAEVSFAVVLLTPDDEGGLKGATLRPRARQNVILELGYFLGRLGRGHVAAIYKGNDLDIPSDYHGVLFTEFDSRGGWRFDLVRELKAAGFVVDANQAV